MLRIQVHAWGVWCLSFDFLNVRDFSLYFIYIYAILSIIFEVSMTEWSHEINPFKILLILYNLYGNEKSLDIYFLWWGNLQLIHDLRIRLLL